MIRKILAYVNDYVTWHAESITSIGIGITVFLLALLLP